MSEQEEEFHKLAAKLDGLLRRQDEFSVEIHRLRRELEQLRPESAVADLTDSEVLPIKKRHQQTVKKTVQASKEKQPARQLIKRRPKVLDSFNQPSFDWEKFVGENLINKIGILITVIGVVIGAKYTIDHDLISPLTRIVLGFLVGLGLLGIGMKLKAKYESFSAVLVSGAMAIMYFITFAAYSFYGLFPQGAAFGLMALFTVFTTYAAIKYNRQIIGHIGLVGAYAVPFLLSDGTGNVLVLFTYTAIINVGILYVAFRRNWKSLYYSAFVFTWLIYLAWYLISYQASRHFNMALVFVFAFFVIFYTMFLAYKLVQKEQYHLQDVGLLLLNSFLFYGIGYSVLVDHELGQHLLGAFTLVNAVLHFVVSMIIYRRKLVDKKLLYLISGLVLVFITIAIPVQLDGNWVTLLWAGEAALLFWLGRSKGVGIYENLSYPLMVLAFFSMVQDWDTVQREYLYFGMSVKPFLNANFLTSVLFAGAFGFIAYLQHKNKGEVMPSEKIRSKFARLDIQKIFSFLVPAVFLISVYQMFNVQIDLYWRQWYEASGIEVFEDGVKDSIKNYDYYHWVSIWKVNYSLLFVSILSFLVLKFKQKSFVKINLGLNALAIAFFLMVGLYEISELRQSFIHHDDSSTFNVDWFHVGIRYVSFLLLSMALFATYRLIRESNINKDLRKIFDILFYLTLLWVASSELLNWMDLGGNGESYKLALSILWGSYSLIIIGLGIWKKKKYLRIAAIGLFAVTLAKLMFYDIAHLDTISKTIVFVSLGVLLLIISFLYNKYKYIIADEPES